MGGRMRRTGIAVAALSLLLVAGPASADSGWQGLDQEIHPVAPGTYDSGWSGMAQEIHPVAPGAKYDSSWQGLDEETHPVAPGTKVDSGWQGLDEEIHPVAPGSGQADSTESAPSSETSDMPVFALVLALGLATLIAVMAAAYRRRLRTVQAG